MAITVPNTTRNCWLDSLNERNPTMSEKMAIRSATDVSVVPALMAFLLASSPSADILLALSPDSSRYSSRTLLTTCSP